MSIKLNSFVVADPHKCIGCKVCEVVCAVEHLDRECKTVGTIDAPLLPKLFLVKTPKVTMPIQCRHCEDAPCANVCPVAAISEVDNKILVDEKICVGCKTCMMACPFGAMDLVPRYQDGQVIMQEVLTTETEDGVVQKEAMVANKCDLCVGRVEGPACIQACPAQALELIAPHKEKRKRNVAAALNLMDSVKKFMS